MTNQHGAVAPLKLRLCLAAIRCVGQVLYSSVCATRHATRSRERIALAPDLEMKVANLTEHLSCKRHRHLDVHVFKKEDELVSTFRVCESRPTHGVAKQRMDLRQDQAINDALGKLRVQELEEIQI